MQGMDFGQIAMNAITYLGGPAGGAMLLFACLASAIMAALGWCGQHRILHTFYCSAGAWSTAFIFRTWLAWNV